MFIAEVGKLSMVGKSEVWIIVDSGKLSRESDGREICSRKKDVAPTALGLNHSSLPEEKS